MEPDSERALVLVYGALGYSHIFLTPYKVGWSGVRPVSVWATAPQAPDVRARYTYILPQCWVCRAVVLPYCRVSCVCLVVLGWWVVGSSRH